MRVVVLIWVFILLRVLWSELSTILPAHPIHLCGRTNLELYVMSSQRGLQLPAITRREGRQRIRLSKLSSSRIFRHQGYQYLLPILTTCLVLSGDIELNPGPTFKFACVRCEKPVKSNQKGLQCYSCDQWFHCSCEHVPTETCLALGNCEDSWYCARYSLPPLSDSFFGSPSVLHHGTRPSCGSNGDDHDHDLDSPGLRDVLSRHKNGYLFCHLNVRSLLRCFDEIYDHIAPIRAGKLFLSLSETWLDPKLPDGVVSILGTECLEGIGVDVEGVWPFTALMALGAGGGKT